MACGGLGRDLTGQTWLFTISVAGLVFVHILPHAISEVGAWEVTAAVFGLLLPFVIERVTTARPASGFRIAAALALLGLAVHGMIEGVGLAGGKSDAEGGELVALAVVLPGMARQVCDKESYRSREG